MAPNFAKRPPIPTFVHPPSTMGVEMNFGSLFAGIGGIDLGLERAGMRCKWQVEIDDYASRVLEKHWPRVKRHRDIRTFPTSGDWSVDLIAAGFPCQDLSIAGKGEGLDGKQSGLFFEVIRVVGEIRPKYVLLENVSALLARGMDTVLGELASLGYDAEWHCIPASSVGAPHIRDRVFIVAYANRSRSPYGWEARRVGRIMESIDDSASFKRGSHWAVEPSVGRVADGVPRRVDRLKGLGNAVVPQVAELIGRHILASQCQ